MASSASRKVDDFTVDNLKKLLALSHIEEPRRFWEAVVAFLQDIAPHSVAVVSLGFSAIIFHDGLISEDGEDGRVLRIAQVYREIKSNVPIGVLSSGFAYDIPTGLCSIGLGEFCKTRAFSHPLIAKHKCDHLTVLSTIFYHEDLQRHNAASIVMYHRSETAEVAYANIGRYRPHLEPIIAAFCGRMAKLDVENGWNAFVADLPIGMLLAGSHDRPIYANSEAYRQTYLWNVAPLKKVPSDYRLRFKMPRQIAQTIDKLGIGWRYWNVGQAETFETEDHVISDVSPELHATVKIVWNRSDPFSVPEFLIRLSMIHPRDQPNALEMGDLKVSALAELTNAERKVALHVVRGFSNNEIANMLGRQSSTIKEHLTHIYGKLKVRDRTQLIGRLIERSGAQEFSVDDESLRLSGFVTSSQEAKTGPGSSRN